MSNNTIEQKEHITGICDNCGKEITDTSPWDDYLYCADCNANITGYDPRCQLPYNPKYV